MLLHRLDVVKLELVHVGCEKSLVVGQLSYSYLPKVSTLELGSDISSAPTKGRRTGKAGLTNFRQKSSKQIRVAKYNYGRTK